MGSISHHITPLVINSLGGGHTHTQAYRRSRTEAILRNLVRAGLRPACAWFNNQPSTNNWYLLVQTNLIQSFAMDTLEDLLASGLFIVMNSFGTYMTMVDHLVNLFRNIWPPNRFCSSEPTLLYALVSRM